MGTPQTILVANIGMADTLILMVLALVVFGPRRLPQIGRQIGKLMYEFRKASNDFKFQMEEELRNAEETERRQKEEERLKALAASNPPAEAASSTDSAATPNPYPWESVYPPLTDGTPVADSSATEAISSSTEPVPSADGASSVPSTAPAAEAPAQTEAPVLAVQPPSEGEVVATAAPAAVAEPARDATPAEALSAEPAPPKRRRAPRKQSAENTNLAEAALPIDGSAPEAPAKSPKKVTPNG